MAHVTYVLPLAISVNKLHRTAVNRKTNKPYVYKTKEAKQYTHDVYYNNLDKRVLFKEAWLYMIISPRLYKSSKKEQKRRVDIDNYNKLVFDSLQGLAFENDTVIKGNGHDFGEAVVGGKITVEAFDNELEYREWRINWDKEKLSKLNTKNVIDNGNPPQHQVMIHEMGDN